MATYMLERASGLMRANVRLSMSTLTYSVFQALLLLRRMYVTFWGIVSASHPPDNQFLHPSRHSLPCLIPSTTHCKAALDLLYRALTCPQRQKPFKGLHKCCSRSDHDECLLLVHDYGMCSSYWNAYFMCMLLVPQIHLFSCQAVCCKAVLD